MRIRDEEGPWRLAAALVKQARKDLAKSLTGRRG